MRFWAVTVVLMSLAASAWPDSLFSQRTQQEGTLISDRTARFEIGDIITVLVREEIAASTQSDTDTRKEADVESEANEADNELITSEKGLNLLNAEELPNFKVEAEKEHRTTGQTQRDTTLETTVTCFVTQVLPNGNIMVEGERLVAVNREDSMLHVMGVARAKDVTTGNTITSAQLANARVELRGRGPLWKNQRRGLVTKFLDWVSPF